MRRGSLAAAAVAAIALLCAAAKPSPPLSYTADQADRGRLLYYRHCAECHGGDLGGAIGPALAGPDARNQWESPQYVYGYFKVHMPHGEPGTLPVDDDLAIMAFLLRRHAKPPGRTALTEPAVMAATAPLGGP